VSACGFSCLASTLSAGDSPEDRESENQKKYKQGDENEKYDLRNPDRCTGNPAKAKDRCDDSDDQKDKRPVKHWFILCWHRNDNVSRGAAFRNHQ
jgi:hypothetical protein